MPGTGSISSKFPGDCERQLATIFRGHHWKVQRRPSVADRHVDIEVSKDSSRYVVELKVASEGRADRLVPLLAQAILQAQAFARVSPGPSAPLAVVAAPAISPGVAARLQLFAARNAPELAVGIFDREGFQSFSGPGLEKLNASHPGRVRRRQLPMPGSASLFSGLDQWMLKVLLAPLLPEGLLRAPRNEYRNASQLAEAAKVSGMSAFRFVRQLRQEGFLDHGADSLRLVRRAELMRRWQASHLRAVPQLPLRWIIPVNADRGRLSGSLRDRLAHPPKRGNPEPRACLGLFGAAGQLGFGFVHGVLPSFYLETLDREALAHLGLSPEWAERAPDVYVQVPGFRESVFRASVLSEGVPVADIIQVWLDVSSNPARGADQAEEIRKRALGAVFDEKR